MFGLQVRPSAQSQRRTSIGYLDNTVDEDGDENEGGDRVYEPPELNDQNGRDTGLETKI